MDDEKVFSGFIFPAPKGHTQIPNGWYDEIVSQIDNVAELKVVLYILRHTCGFQRAEEAQRLTVDEFMHGRIFSGRRIDRGTGLSEMSVRNGLKSAIKHGYIVCEPDDSDKGNVKKCYKLRFSGVQDLDPKEELGVQSLDQTGTKSIPSGVQSLGETGTNFRPQSPSGEKEKERNLKEREKERDIHSISPSSSKPRRMGLLKAPIREVLQAIGDDQPETYHFERVHSLWLECDIDDIKAFRDKIYAAKTQATGRDMEYFYRCLESNLQL